MSVIPLLPHPLLKLSPKEIKMTEFTADNLPKGTMFAKKANGESILVLQDTNEEEMKAKKAKLKENGYTLHREDAVTPENLRGSYPRMLYSPDFRGVNTYGGGFVKGESVIAKSKVEEDTYLKAGYSVECPIMQNPDSLMVTQAKLKGAICPETNTILASKMKAAPTANKA